MSRKSFGILIVVAATFVVLAIIGQNRDDTESIAGASAGSLLLPALTDDVEGIGQVLLDGAGSERLVTLERAGDGWNVAELGGYPAERTRINTLLIALAEARIVEEKTADPAFHARLGVEDIEAGDAAGVRVALVTEGGARHAVVLGDRYTTDQRYARIPDQEQSVLIDRNPELPRDPSEWVDPAIIDVAGDRVRRVEITHADGERLVLRKDARGDANFNVEDIPEDRELQYSGVANVTGNLLQGLELDEVARRSDEPADPTVTTELSTFDGLVVTVTALESEDETNAWLRFRADVDAAQALAFARDSADDDAEDDAADAAEPADADPDSDAAADAQADPVANVTAEAEAINARLAEWRYRIPSYQFSQLTRRMEDLLAPEADE